MGQISITKTPIEGLLIIEPAIHKDKRGYFMETYNRRDLLESGIDAEFVQDNESMSVKGVLRGMHFQKEFPQAKIVRVLDGKVFDVAVDLREGSGTYGKWHGVELTGENERQFFIPEGFAHGFLVMSDTARFCYKVTDYWHPGDEGGIAWNDPAIGIVWPGVKEVLSGTSPTGEYCLEDGTPLILSDKDRNWPNLESCAKK